MTPAQQAMLDDLARDLDPAAIVTDRDMIAPWEVDWRQRYRGHAPALLAPRDTAGVATVAVSYTHLTLPTSLRV